MTKFAPIGSVSHGTMRPEDLIPKFLYTLGQIDKAAHNMLVEEYKDVLDSDNVDEMQQDACLETLFQALDECAPPYCYFGAHEGDGADYGFWISWDSLNEDTQTRERSTGEFSHPHLSVAQIEAGEEWDACHLPGFIEYVLEVNDHGNATLFTRDGTEVWSCV